MTPHCNNAEFWKEFVHGSFFSCHEILIKRKGPLRMFFDCECDIDMGMVFTVEDQQDFFGRFIDELIETVNNMLVKWDVCTDKDSLD
jgi:hypothetical protein